MARPFRIPARFISFVLVLLALLGFLAGCATSPATGSALTADPTTNPPASPVPVHATLDEAATAALARAHASTPRHRRASIQIGTLRRVEGGFVAMPPRIEAGSVLDATPSVLRLDLTAADVALYVLHPRSGDHELDARNAALSTSERRLMRSRDGSPRPVYLLTPRLEVVRHAGDRRATPIARLRPKGASGSEALLATVED